MKKSIILNIDEEILLRFNMALQLNNQTSEEVCEAFMKRYFLESFSKEANLYGYDSSAISSVKGEREKYFGKALSKISKWAKKPKQINYKILRAYLQIENELKFVTYDDLMLRCSNEEKHPDVYVATFHSNFEQMKFDSEKSYGKVFEVNENQIVTLWDYVKDEIMNHKGDFLKELSTSYGYLNRNNQRNIGRTDEKGTDHSSVLYMMRCENCKNEYFANSTDIHLKKCPKCQGGADTGAN